MNPRQRGRRTTDVPGPDSVAGPGPGTSIGDDYDDEHALGEGYPDEQVLVDDDELALIRWAGYDAAIAEATEHRDRTVEAAADRLDKATRAAYADYGQAVDAAEKSFAAARRAAMNAHELAHAGQATP